MKCDRSNIEKALRNLPKTLDETYDRILSAVPAEERLSVHYIFRWISFHNELYDGDGIPCNMLIQAVGKSTAKLAANGLERFYDNDSLRELCGCLIKIAPIDNTGTDGNVRYTTLAVSFAHYTVREYLNSSRSKNWVASFTVRQEEYCQELLQIVLSEIYPIDRIKLRDCLKAFQDDFDVRDAVYDWTAYCMISTFLSLRKWRDEILSHEKFYTLADGLLPPSGLHSEFVELVVQATNTQYSGQARRRILKLLAKMHD